MVSRRSRRSGEPRTAAMMQQATVPRKGALLPASTPKSWEREVMDFDRNGPGILGYYLDIVALMGSMSPLYVEVKNKHGVWEKSTDPVLAVALSGWAGRVPAMTQTELMYQAIRSREATGRCWHVNDSELGWSVVSTAVPEDGYLAWTTLYGTPRRTPKDRVYYSWIPDTYEPWLPTSPTRRALPELRRLRATVRNQTRSAQSRLLTNGMIAFPGDDNDTARPLAAPSNVDGEETELTGVDAVVDDYLDMARLAFRDDDSPAAHVPFPYIGKPAQWIDMGGVVDQATLEMEKTAIEAFARAVNFPQQLLVQGPGAANHWNEYLLQEAQVKLGLAPKIGPVCADVTTFHLRPTVQLLNARLDNWSCDPNRVRVAADLDFLLKRPSRFSEMVQAYGAGAVSRRVLADELGVTDMLDIPHGMSEYEHWQLQAHVSGAPYAEVGPNGDLIIPPPPQDPAMMGGDPTAGGGGFQLGPAAPAGPPALPPGGSGGDGGPPAGEQPVAEPPMPQLAAASTRSSNRFDPNRVFRSAEDGDRRLEAALAAITAATVAAINAEIAKQVILATPARSLERAGLRDLPLDKVWAAASPTAQAKVDVAQVVADTAERYRPQVEAAYEDAKAGFVRRWGPWAAAALAADPGPDASAAFFAALIPWFMVVFAAGKSWKAKPPTAPPRSSMLAAGGAQVAADGNTVESAGGTPVPVSGGPWEGSVGYLTGHNAVKAITAAAGEPPVMWRWNHGFYGEPEIPFPPHVDLDGREFASPEHVPGGWAIGDHRGCRCQWTVVWPTRG